MKRKKKILISLLTALTSILIAFVFWYNLTVNIEDMNTMHYCTCGYSKVEFKDSKIYMGQYPFHDTVKPGDCIGTYKIIGDEVAISLTSRGKVYTTSYILDNIGLKDEAPEPTYDYYAFNRFSLRILIYRILRKIGL